MSIRTLSTVLVTLSVLLVVGAGHPGLVAVAAQQVITIKPRGLQPVPDRQLSTGERLAQLEKALGSPGDPHDVIPQIAAIGDATSVPFLIEALAKQGTVPPEVRTPPLTLVFTSWRHSNQSLITMPDVTPKTGGVGTKRTRTIPKPNGSKMGSWITDFPPPIPQPTGSSRR